MKNLLLHYAAYNHWANQQLVKVLLKLKEEQLDRDLGGGLSTLRAGVYYLWSAEYCWYERLQLTEKAADPSEGFEGTLADACAEWLKQSLLLEKWVEKATLVKLDHTIAFTQKKSEHYKMPVQDVIMEMCNNSTFYRGQLVYMLEQLGVSRIPVISFGRFKPKK
ncbi:DinB family protein [Chitinophaga sp. 212800010-3]|uniref:DinB family protein n=1 Tax=unclassified Chitinophaga TaxID=2619133 RepID=UPI002DF18D76|nr:Damage-inducible protein DinB [Chitinophaga sp. 212800010-3]